MGRASLSSKALASGERETRQQDNELPWGRCAAMACR